MKRGYFITLEGPDGAGKTTQLERLAQKAAEMRIPAIQTREPGGTPVGDAVREILLDPAYGEMVPLTEVFLYAAARAQLVHQMIEPALNGGKLVLCDRFIDSTLAYQAYGGQMEFDFVLQTNLKAIKGRLPDRTFVIDVAPEQGFARRSPELADRVEQKALSFHHDVRRGFLDIAKRYPERVVIIDGTMPEDQVFAAIWSYAYPPLAALL